MTDQKPIDPTELDAAQTAKKIEEAGVADESAAYTDAIANKTGDGEEAEAHPS